MYLMKEIRGPDSNKSRCSKRNHAGSVKLLALTLGGWKYYFTECTACRILDLTTSDCVKFTYFLKLEIRLIQRKWTRGEHTKLDCWPNAAGLYRDAVRPLAPEGSPGERPFALCDFGLSRTGVETTLTLLVVIQRRSSCESDPSERTNQNMRPNNVKSRAGHVNALILR